MNKMFAYNLFFVFMLLSAVNFYGVKVDLPIVEIFCSRNNSPLNQNSDIAAQVKKAFNAVRKNGGGQPLLSDLKSVGEKVIPYLEPYLSDENLDVRREVIYLAIDIGGDKSLDLTALALRNSAPEIQKAAAKRLYLYYSQYRKYLPVKKFLPISKYAAYESFSPEKIAANQLLGKSLRESLKTGNTDISTIYLLANFSDDETTTILKEMSSESALDFRTVALASKITLSSLKNQEATRELVETINRNDVATLLFLLANINEIKSIELLSSLTKTLDNKSDITGGKGIKNPNLKLPGGVRVQGIPERRLCDFAVNSFIEKYNLNGFNENLNRKISFGLHSTTYREEQISEVRDLLKIVLK